MTVFTNKRLKHNRSDIPLTVEHHKTHGNEHLSTLQCQRTKNNILTTEEEKSERYQDLALEIKRIHRATRVTV